MYFYSFPCNVTAIQPKTAKLGRVDAPLFKFLSMDHSEASEGNRCVAITVRVDLWISKLSSATYRWVIPGHSFSGTADGFC